MTDADGIRSVPAGRKSYIYFKSDKILDFRLQIRYTKSALSVADFFGGVLSDEFKSKTANRN